MLFTLHSVCFSRHFGFLVQCVKQLCVLYPQDAEGVVTCSDETRHNLTDEDYVTFREVEGMTELNGCQPKRVKTLGRYNGRVW